MVANRTDQTRSARTPLPQSIRFNVLRRDNFTCRYCGRSSPDVVLHVDHKQPVSRGGDNNEENLVTACGDCNGGKGAKAAVKAPALRARASTAGMVGLFGLSFENDVVRYQFSIERALGGGLYAVQTYSWIDGAPVDVQVMEGAFLQSTQCRLFLTLDSWHEATNRIIEDQYEARKQRRAEDQAPKECAS